MKKEIVALCKSNGEEIRNSVYRFINKEREIIYVGKAKNLRSRLRGHSHLSSECYEETEEIHYTTFETEDDMDLAERYLISKIKPKYNEVFKKKEITVEIEEFEFLTWYK